MGNESQTALAINLGGNTQTGQKGGSRKDGKALVGYPSDTGRVAAEINNLAPGYIVVDDEGNAAFGEELIQKLQDFQTDHIDYRTELEPRTNNLFFAGFFYEHYPYGSGELQGGILYNAAFRIQSIKIQNPSMSFQTDKYTRQALFNEAQHNYTVNISWKEDVYCSIMKFHLDWSARWYNRYYDVLRCGSKGKFRRVVVVSYHYVDGANSNSIINVPVIQPLYAIDVAGMVPLNIGEWNFDYNNDGNDQTVDMTYLASRITWFPSDQIGLKGGDKDSVWTAGGWDKKAVESAKTWDPRGFNQDGGWGQDYHGNPDQPFEKLRTVRSYTSYMAGEANF